MQLANTLLLCILKRAQKAALRHRFLPALGEDLDLFAPLYLFING
jgi:hypothetical protein